MAEKFIFTSESVSEGHPDKIADQVSDAILDAILTQDPKARVACETLVTTGMAVIAGEITTNAVINYSEIARQTIREIGYTDSEMGFDADTCAVLVSIDRQSPDISQGVSEGEGLHQKTREHCDMIVSIPQKGGVESLNAGNAAAIVFYELSKKI